MAAIHHDDNRNAALNQVEHPKSEKHTPDFQSLSNSEPELDGIHDGLTFPTEEEILTLKRVSDAIPWNAYREGKH